MSFHHDSTTLFIFKTNPLRSTDSLKSGIQYRYRLRLQAKSNWNETRDYCEVSVGHSSGTGGAENEVVSSLANSIFKLSAKSCRDASEVKSRLICWQNMLQFLRIYLQILVTHSKYYPIWALFLHSLKFLKTKVEGTESLKYVCSPVCLPVYHTCGQNTKKTCLKKLFQVSNRQYSMTKVYNFLEYQEKMPFTKILKNNLLFLKTNLIQNSNKSIWRNV